MDVFVLKRDDFFFDVSVCVVNIFFIEFDGVGDWSGIYVIGVINRLDIIDEVICCFGCLGISIYVGLFGLEDCIDIFKMFYCNIIIC